MSSPRLNEPEWDTQREWSLGTTFVIIIGLYGAYLCLFSAWALIDACTHPPANVMPGYAEALRYAFGTCGIGLAIVIASVCFLTQRKLIGTCVVACAVAILLLIMPDR